MNADKIAIAGITGMMYLLGMWLARRSYGWVIELVMAGLATAIILTLVAVALA
jgi:hypothetical protein